MENRTSCSGFLLASNLTELCELAYHLGYMAAVKDLAAVNGVIIILSVSSMSLTRPLSSGYQRLFIGGVLKRGLGCGNSACLSVRLRQSFSCENFQQQSCSRTIPLSKDV